METLSVAPSPPVTNSCVLCSFDTPTSLSARMSDQNMTHELAIMKTGKGKVFRVSGVDDGPVGGGGAAISNEEG